MYINTEKTHKGYFPPAEVKSRSYLMQYCQPDFLWTGLFHLLWWRRPENTYLQHCGEKSVHGNDNVTLKYCYLKPCMLFGLIRPLLRMTLGGSVSGVCSHHKSQCTEKIHSGATKEEKHNPNTFNTVRRGPKTTDV